MCACVCALALRCAAQKSAPVRSRSQNFASERMRLVRASASAHTVASSEFARAIAHEERSDGIVASERASELASASEWAKELACTLFECTSELANFVNFCF